MTFNSRFSRLFMILMLRKAYHRRPIDLQALLHKEQCLVESSLDLGSGPNPRNPFGATRLYGVDIRSYDICENVLKCNLGFDSLPFGDSSMGAVTAFDVLEHIPRFAMVSSTSLFPFVSLMNEIWRVLRFGGLFYSLTPAYPFKEAFQDPTHVNIMTEDTLDFYFGPRGWARIYGFFGSFDIVEQGWQGSKYFCLMRKSSLVPVNDVNAPQY